MNWEALGAIGEIVGAVAVVLTLGYVAVQLRQNTKITRSAVRQSIAGRSSEWGLCVSQNDQVLAVVTKAMQGKELSPEEIIRLDLCFASFFRTVEEAFIQHREGYLDDEYWKTRWAVMNYYLSLPGMLQRWRGRLDTRYHPAFAAWVESQIAGQVDQQSAEVSE